MSTRGTDGRFQPRGNTRDALDGDIEVTLPPRPADSQQAGSQQAPGGYDHAAHADWHLHSAELDGAALPPSLRLEAAKAHALLALADELRQLRTSLRTGGR